MKCAYCNQEKPVTREHIIPDGLLTMFAECKFTIRGDNYFQGDPVIKDVCFKCNNDNLSQLDSFGIELIKENFVKEYEPDSIVTFDYNYNLLLRWLLKLAYNNERSFKRNNDVFQKYIGYILGDDNECRGISLFAGLAVDTSPMPEFYHDNQKLQIVTSPKFIEKSILEPIDPLGFQVRVREDMECLNFPELQVSFLLRFGSSMFLVVIWKERTPDEVISSYERIISNIYPYSLIIRESTKTELKRVNHAFNIHNIVLIDTDVGMSFADNSNALLPKDKNPINVRKSLSKEWDKYVDEVRLKASEERKKKKK